MTSKRKPLTDADGNVRELTKEDFARMVTFDQLPKEHQEAWRAIKRRGPQKAPTKEQVTLRLSPRVLEHYKAGGPGWQTRIDRALLSGLPQLAHRNSSAGDAKTVRRAGAKTARRASAKKKARG